MELDNKYYIPSIEEFYVGFEYCWKDEIYSQEFFGKLETLEDLENQILEDKIRVKYLDKEDIESLGWKVVENVGNTEFEMGLNYIMWFNKTDKNDLTILRRTELIQPRNPPIIHNQWEGLFCGIIKNKSELKKLMQQLQINED